MINNEKRSSLLTKNVYNNDHWSLLLILVLKKEKRKKEVNPTTLFTAVIYEFSL